jgi:hypothetical protein
VKTRLFFSLSWSRALVSFNHSAATYSLRGRDSTECLGPLACVEAGFFLDLRNLEFFEGFQGDVFGAEGWLGMRARPASSSATGIH